MYFRALNIFSILFLLTLVSTALHAQEKTKSPKTLTIYTNGLALVDEVREIQSGVSTTVTLANVSPMMLPDSVQIGLGDDTVVREIAFDSDILTHQTLFKRALGKKVRLVRTNPATGVETVEEATVLSVSGGLVLNVGGRIETSPSGRIVFDSVPEDLHATPTLSLRVSEPILKPTPATLTYLTNGLTWDGVYTVVLNETHTSAEMNGWARVNNSSGLDFEDVRVSLVAGQVQRVSAPPRGKILMRAESAVMAAAPMGASDPAPQQLSAFHIFDIVGNSTLRDKESRQLRLISGKKIKVFRALEFRNGAAVFGALRQASEPQSAWQRVRIVNSDENGLGKPIPGGLVRAYMRDASGTLRFLGEERINNTPKGEEMTLDLGRAFDVTMHRNQSDFKRIGDRSNEAAFELTINNGGKEDAVVDVMEDIPGDWKMLSSDKPHTREGIAARWRINVPAGGSEKIIYRVFVRR